VAHDRFRHLFHQMRRADFRPRSDKLDPDLAAGADQRRGAPPSGCPYGTKSRGWSDGRAPAHCAPLLSQHAVSRTLWTGRRYSHATGFKAKSAYGFPRPKAAVCKMLCASWQRCRVHFMRDVWAHARKQWRRVVAPLSPLPSPRTTLTSPRPNGVRSPINCGPGCRSLPSLTDKSETDVLAYMNFRPRIDPSCPPPTPSSASSASEPAHRGRRHLPQRRDHHALGRRHPAQAER
jgi:hypothetical protein